VTSKRNALAALCSAALVVLGACIIEPSSGNPSPLPGQAGNADSSPRARRAPHGGPVFAVGDSLLLGAVEQGGLGVKLASDGWDLETVAETGKTVRWAVDQVRLRDAVARYVIVVLGTNPGFSSAGFSDDVATLRDALVARGARHILWIPPHRLNSDGYADKDTILQELSRTDRVFVTPDWGKVMDANPQWVVADGLHYTEMGYTAFADFIRDQLARLG